MPVTPLAPGLLDAVQCGYAVDGRVSRHSRRARGHSSLTCYLLREEDGTLLIDTGVAAHRRQILDAVGAGTRPDEAYVLTRETGTATAESVRRHLLRLLPEARINELGAALVCPTHGLPVGDPAGTAPAVYEGMRRAGRPPRTSQPPTPN